jgi:hypothetical protein
MFVAEADVTCITQVAVHVSMEAVNEFFQKVELKLPAAMVMVTGLTRVGWGQ